MRIITWNQCCLCVCCLVTVYTNFRLFFSRFSHTKLTFLMHYWSYPVMIVLVFLCFWLFVGWIGKCKYLVHTKEMVFSSIVVLFSLPLCVYDNTRKYARYFYSLIHVLFIHLDFRWKSKKFQFYLNTTSTLRNHDLTKII